MARAPQTLTALRDVSSLYSIHLVSPFTLCPSELNFIKAFTVTQQQRQQQQQAHTGFDVKLYLMPDAQENPPI